MPDGACAVTKGADYAGHVSGLGNWWDSVELWVTGLPFVPQVAVVMVVLVPLAALLARLFDVTVAGGLKLLGRDATIVDAGQDEHTKHVEVEN